MCQSWENKKGKEPTHQWILNGECSDQGIHSAPSEPATCRAVLSSDYRSFSFALPL